MRSFLVLAVSAVATLTVLSGCSGSDEGESSSVAAAATTSADFCETMCRKVSDCDSTQDAQTCTRKCQKDLGPMFGKMREELVEGVLACWTATACRDVGGERLVGCLDEAAVHVTPSDSATALCDALGKSVQKCDGSIGRASCLSDMKIYSDATLAEAISCTEKSCSAVDECVKASL